jgi:hypothetical protein
MLRPSLKSTESVSSDTVTLSANGTANSTVEVLIPDLHKFDSMIVHQLYNPCNFDARKPTTALKSNRIEPELRDPIVSLHMDVLWFVAVTRLADRLTQLFPPCW